MFHFIKPGYYTHRKGRNKKGPNRPNHVVGPYPHRYEEHHARSGFPADLAEKEDEYIIQAELAGVNRDDIKVELDDETILITATRRETCDAEEDSYLCQERVIGTFQRMFPLENIREEEIKADFTDGLLTIKVPKLNQPQSSKKEIEIQ